MNTRILVPLVFSILAVFFFAGCYGVDHNFSNMRNDLLSATGKSFHRDVEFSLGPFSLAVAKVFISFSDDGDDAKEIIKHISKVQIAVYKNDDHILSEDRYSILKNIDDKMCRQGWSYIVKSTHNGEIQTIYVMKDSEERLRKMFVISLNKKELAMVEVGGNLEEALAAVIKEKGLGVQYAGAAN